VPFINVKTNIEVTKEHKEIVKQKLGKAIELIPGKSEEWLMVAIDDKVSLYFKGKTDKPIAFVEIKIFGSTTEEAYQLTTAQITRILNEELQVAPDQIFIAYSEIEHWGWNGSNF
jgi:phenylpyruvate tautomerase PptA (4-oxalocrotonate tautomerase family)